MHKHGLCCPSVTLVHCIHMAEDIVKLLSQPVSHIILVFAPPPASTGTQFQEEPLQWGAKYTGVGKVCKFRLKSPFISEMTPDGAIVTIERL